MDSDWRVISFRASDAATNMAVDEAILESHLSGWCPPTLRFYGFTPPAISIGYAQRLKPEEEKSIREAGFDLVRRPTGGRAVLHLDDLTYSFVGSSPAPNTVSTSNDRSKSDDAAEILSSGAPAIEPSLPGQSGFLSPSVSGAYKQICEGLIQGMRSIGVDLDLGTTSADYRASYDCFVATTTADLHFKGKKMIGSAQMRRKQGVLQHGSILLCQEQNKMASLFGDQTDNVRHANLFDVMNREMTITDLQYAIAEGFAKAFHKTFLPGELTEQELRLVRELLRKYTQFAARPE